MSKSYETSGLTIERIKKYLEEGKRFDGRKPNEFRDIQIETDISINAEGSARVKIGKTEVLVGVKMDIDTPYPDSKNKGNLIVNAELLPLSSERFESGPPKFPSIELGRIVDRFIRESKLIELEKLCIKEGEKVWNVFIDVYSINDDGNLLDAAGIGAIIALKNSKIPEYDVENDSINYEKRTNKKIPLTDKIPISITVYKVGKTFIVDPTREEEDASNVRVTVGVSNDGILHSMQKGDKGEITIEELSEIVDLAENVRTKLFKKLEKYLK